MLFSRTGIDTYLAVRDFLTQCVSGLRITVLFRVLSDAETYVNLLMPGLE